MSVPEHSVKVFAMRASMLRWSVAAALVAALGSGVAVFGQQALTPMLSFAEPGISPDGREIAFVSGGDIWTVPSSGGDARLLVAHDATESRPLFSPDGRTLAFVSTRTGGGDIYLFTIETGQVRRVTADDGLEQLDGWSHDGKWIYFSSTSRDISGMNDIYRVSADGGTPMAVSADRYTNEFGAAASPDGTKIVFSARGTGSAQWWRKAGSHLDQAELWIASTTGAPNYSELTARDGRAMWPMWSGDGKSIFYVTDRNGTENLWLRPAGAGADKALTKFTTGRVLWPSITTDGKTIAFERNFGIWTADAATGQARELKITRRGTPTMAVAERTRQTNQFSDLALSPDGKKIAFIARGELFAASASDGGDAMRVTNTAAIESQPVWSADSRKLAYVSDRDGGQHIYMYDFATNKEEAVTSGPGRDLSPTFSPDGKTLVYLRDLRALRAIDLAAKTDSSVATGSFGDALDSPKPMFSPDGRWIAIFAIGEKQFSNVNLVPFAPDATPKIMQPVSFLANVFANTIAWSHDGTYLLFDTSQRTESGQLARVDLTLRTPKFREDTFRDLFNQPARPGNPPPPATPASPAPANPSPSVPSIPATPTSPVFADVRQRLSLLPTGLDVQSVSISPDGKVAVLIAAAAGQQNLYTWPLEELASNAGVARQLTSTASGKSDVQFSPDSKDVFYLDNGRVSAVSLDRREVRPVNVTAEFTLDFESEKFVVFNQAWSLLRDNFFDPKFNGVDWDEARHVYLPRIAGAATADEMRRIVRLMIGELNASHLGFTGGTPTSNNVGRLGLSFDRAEYETTGRLKITNVTTLGPAAITRAISVGDVLTAVDGKAIGPRVNLDELLANTIDRRVTLTIAPAGGAATREVAIKPVNQGTEKNLLYRQWVEANRAYVLKKSGGRLGYVHMIDMGQGSLDQLFIDLDAENHSRDGVIVDIRNNNGGFVNAYALDALARQPYLRMSLRGLPTAPARVVLGQRALEKPTALVVNQHSLSDAEDFTEGYRTLKLGPIVGEPTAGWIIYTWNVRLVDGSTLRLPRMRITAVDGTDMERHSRPVDIEATRPIGETLTDKDSQLDAAIRALLAKLGRAE
jgi:tricorn protease